MDIITFSQSNGSEGQTITMDNGTAYKEFLLIEFSNIPIAKGAEPKPPKEVKMQIDQVENILNINGVDIKGIALHLLKEYLSQLK